MSVPPTSKFRAIVLLISWLVARYKWYIVLYSILSLPLLPLLEQENTIRTHTLLTEGAIPKVSDEDVTFSQDIEAVLQRELPTVPVKHDIDFITDSKDKLGLFPEFSDFIEHSEKADVPRGYLNIGDAILEKLPEVELYYHRFVYEDAYEYSIFILLKFSTLDTDSTLASSVLLGVLSSLSDKSFLSQNHLYLLVPKRVKYGFPTLAFLDSYNSKAEVPFDKHKIHLAHVLDFEGNCSNSFYLHYEGINGYKPPLDWSAATLKEFARHGVQLNTLPHWESLRRQSFNAHVDEHHSILLERGVPSVTIAGRCRGNTTHKRSLLIRTFHILSRSQSNMDESMDESISFYTFISNTHFLPTDAYSVVFLGFVVVPFFTLLNSPLSRNPKTFLYGIIIYLVNLLLLSLFPYLLMTNATVWKLLNKLLPLDYTKKAHLGLCYFASFFVPLHILNAVLMHLLKFDILVKEDNFPEIVARALGRFKDKPLFKKLIPLEELAQQENSEEVKHVYEYSPSGQTVGFLTALDLASRVFCIFWIFTILSYNVAQAVWLSLVAFIPLITPLHNDNEKNNKNWDYVLILYYFHVFLLYLPLPDKLAPARSFYVNTRSVLFKIFFHILNKLRTIPKELLDFLSFYSHGGFYGKTFASKPLSRLVSLTTNTVNNASQELLVYLFLLYPLWGIQLWRLLFGTRVEKSLHEKPETEEVKTKNL